MPGRASSSSRERPATVNNAQQARNRDTSKPPERGSGESQPASFFAAASVDSSAAAAEPLPKF